MSIEVRSIRFLNDYAINKNCILISKSEINNNNISIEFIYYNYLRFFFQITSILHLIYDF